MDLIVDFPQASRPCDTSPRQELRVSFANDFEVKFVEDLSDKYKEVLWFSKRDIKKIKLQAAWIIKTIKANNMTVAQYAAQNIQETSVFMGLENYLSDTSTCEIRYQRRAMVRAVLIEQFRQLEEGIYDPDMMANVCLEASSWSTSRAQIIALLHAEKR
ncbi:hypothetical protein ACHAXR_011039 [Thalassiosira sp. AJA248-18]